MNKYSLKVLLVLNDNEIDMASKSLSVSQILELMPDGKRKSYSTTYRHLSNMASQGYVKCGLDDGLASTYFIVDSGKSFCMAQI